MTEERTLMHIKFIIDMYSAGVDTADNAMEKIFDLLNDEFEEDDEDRHDCGCREWCGCDCDEGCGGMKIEPTELTKLREYFDENWISYEVLYWADGWYNLHIDLGYVKFSFLTSQGSYGGYHGLIEFYNFRDEPTGYLTADEAIEIYEKVVVE